MQVKAADDPAPLIAAMETLGARRDIDGRTRDRIENEIRTVRAGVRGEREAAYHIEFHCAQNPNIVTLHDLRLELGGRVAQIDHLIINRLFQIWLCESKAFSEGVSINEQGEWSAYYGRKIYGIPSPIEQNKRHAAVLNDVFDKGLVDLPKRFGFRLKPEVKTVVLVSNKARISRPARWAVGRIEGLDHVIKADQLIATIDREVGQRFNEVGIALATLATAVSAETIGRLGLQLAALHRPAGVDWSARFGLGPATTDDANGARRGDDRPSARTTTRPRGHAQPTGTTCELCGTMVSSAVVAYCRTHVSRFDGRILCMDCQTRTARS